MATDSGHIKGDYRRACDICGHRWFMKRDMKYIGQNRWACPDDKDGLTEQQIARHNARVRPLIVKQHKHPKLMSQTPTYLFREGQAFNTICNLATVASSASNVGGTISPATVESAAWCGIYLGDMVEENQRPTSWIIRATSSLLDVCTFLRARQYGDATYNPTEPTNSILYGGLAQPPTGSSALTTVDIALAGLAFLRAYRITSDIVHLTAADRVAWWLRQSQRNDLSLCGTVDQLGNRFYIGGWPWFMSFGKALHANFTIEGAVALWFLKELKAIRGGSYVYGTTTASGDYSAAPAGSIDTMVSDAMDFYFNGHALPAFSGTPVFGTPPWAFYSNSTLPGGVTGDFAFHLDSGVSVTGLNFAYALRGLFETEGYTARVAAALSWLLSFSSNPSFEPGATDGADKRLNAHTGVYDPTFSTSAILLLKKSGADVTMNGSSNYDFRVSGILGPVMAAGNVSVASLKNFLENDIRVRANRTVEGSEVGNPLLRGGATLAMGAISTNIQPGVASATAQLYRQEPKTNNRLENPAA